MKGTELKKKILEIALKKEVRVASKVHLGLLAPGSFYFEFKLV